MQDTGGLMYMTHDANYAFFDIHDREVILLSHIMLTGDAHFGQGVLTAIVV